MKQSVPFGLAEYKARVERARERMTQLHLDAIVVTAPENVFYLSGYQTKAVFTFQPLVLHRSRPAHLVTRQMEVANADLALREGLLGGYSLYQDDEDPLAIASKVICDIIGAGGRAGIELGSWTMPSQRARDLMRACPGVNWEDATALIDRLRLVKSPAELSAVKEAGAIGDSIADKAIAAISPGRTENDVARVVLCELVGSGSEYPGSWPNIMAGHRTGLIHAAWEGEVINENDHMKIEVTGVKHRYHAPSVRTALIGKPPAHLRQDAERLSRAHAAAVAAMEPGRPMKVVNEAAQQVLSGYELSCKVARRSGYSLGIGFPPSWGAQWQIGLHSRVEDLLETGMVFHVVLVGHFNDGRAVGVGCTVALLEHGPERLTRGGIFDVAS